MLEPNGPLPPEIYWRRRAFAIAALVVALVLVIWLVLTATRGGGTPDDAAAAASSSSSSAPPVTSQGNPGSSGGGQSATSTSAAGGAAAGNATPDNAVPGGAGSGAPAAPGGAPVANQCPDQSLAVKVTVEQPTYNVGDQPIFGIVITNISSGACARDMGSGLQRVSVSSLDGQRQLWSSNDCYPDGQPDIRTLNGGEQAAFTVTWSGATSQAKCAGERVQVPAGAYSVVAQLGSVRSSAEPFNIA
ncbi:hypothetical protein [Nocardia callitridis]|uniref:DUF4232 domain-containing protein n=1 Tax=Nocardia callitridis TaxID=648753 RepID=A0ABP9JZQ5_9NOCA